MKDEATASIDGSNTTQKTESSVQPVKYAYAFTVFGDEETMKHYFEMNGKEEVKRVWNQKKPWIIRRRFFPKFSQALRISRKHVEIVCTQSQDTRKYFVKDLSSNGTLLNELPLPKSELVELKTGDELLVIFTDKKKQGLHFGLKFKVLNESEAEYARIPSKEQILKARAEARKKEQKSKKREREEEPEGEHKKKKTMTEEGFETSDPGSPSAMSDSNSKKLNVSTKPWSHEEEEKLKKVMSENEGKSWKDISVHFPHRSPDAVRNKFKKLSESRSKKRPKPDNESSADDSTHHNEAIVEHTKPATKTQPQQDEEDRRRKPWTPEEDQKLRKLVKKIKPNTQEHWELIANKLGRTVKSIKHKFNDYNLKVLLDD